MTELDQFQIIAEILARSMAVAPPGWRELIVDYYVEGDQSCSVQSYLIEKNGTVVEESLDTIRGLMFLMEDLQGHLAQGGRPPFTRCKIHLKASGQYESTYGYDQVDWDALLSPDWNFFPKRPPNSLALLTTTGRAAPLKRCAILAGLGLGATVVASVLMPTDQGVLGIWLLCAGSISLLGSVLYAFRRTACPRCKTLWLQYALREKSINGWIAWLTTFTKCPGCGLTARDTAKG